MNRSTLLVLFLLDLVLFLILHVVLDELNRLRQTNDVTQKRIAILDLKTAHPYRASTS